MDEFDVKDLSGTALFLTATTGDGDPPDNGSSFWDTLSGDGAPICRGSNTRARFRRFQLRRLLRPCPQTRREDRCARRVTDRRRAS